MKKTLWLRKIPPMLTLEKIFTHHYTYGMLEARAITCLRTGNLVFKNWCRWKFHSKHSGDNKCMFQPCQEIDSLEHVLECQYYATRFSEGGEGPVRDWANFLVALNKERREKFGQPLIWCEGWSTEWS